MSTEAVPTGNTYDKYGTSNPLARLMMRGFQSTLAELLADADPGSILDIGCGEGILTHRWAGERPQARIAGLDLADPKLAAEWDKRVLPNLEFRTHDLAEPFPFADGEFSLVSAIEVLEHVPDPERVVAEMARVTGSHLLASVPREPLWRGLNIARGTYLRELGNTPGHVNHWSKRSFVRLLGRHGDVLEVRSPFPWTMLLVRVRR